MSEQTNTPADEHQSPSAEDHVHTSAFVTNNTERKALTLVALLLFAVALLLGVLIAIVLRPKPANTLSSSDPAIAALKADLEARRNELNHQRVALGLPPLGGSTNSETIEDVASRIKKDITTLTEISGRFQQLLAESDAMATEKGKALVLSEKTRQALLHENSRLMTEREKALSASSSADLQRVQLEQANKELATLRERLASTENRPTEASFETNKRQLEEANRAKSFFETRAKELEAKLADANPDDMAKLRVEVLRLQAELNKARASEPAGKGGK
jgi:DNA repair exonuclease SbcCD ATPase subunit